jgi:hypothetical protein
MAIVILKDLLIDQGEIDRYYDGHVPSDLWRAINRKQPAGLFDFVEEPYTLSNGRVRRADIRIVNRRGEKWVEVNERPRGVSTFDAPGVPVGKDWSYYRIPAGTVLPAGLCIVRDNFNPTYNATHHTIAPAYEMPLNTFKQLLSKLASSVIKEVG